MIAFLNSVGVETIEQLTQDVLLSYRGSLSWHVTTKGTPLTERSQSEVLGHLRAFCRWMVAQDWLVSDPSGRIPNPRKPSNYPSRSWMKQKCSGLSRNRICEWPAAIATA